MGASAFSSSLAILAVSSEMTVTASALGATAFCLIGLAGRRRERLSNFMEPIALTRPCEVAAAANGF
jgi:hypothetical protein